MRRIVIWMITLIIIIGITSCSNVQKKSTSKLEEVTAEKEIKEKILSKEELEVKRLDDFINNLSLEEKLGQMLIVGFDGYEVNDDFRKIIEDYKIGGVILFKRNIQNSKQLLDLNNNIKMINSKNKLPLFISVDEEGGTVTRLPEGSTKFPSNQVIGKINDKNLSYEIGNIIGTELKAFGFNMDFAPVLDIYSNPENTVIGNRAFGNNPKIVSTLGIATMKGLQKSKVIPVVKHFPGHGDTKLDSHIGLPVIDYPKERLDNFELIPFKNAINEGADVVMAAHILFPEIDNTKKPATLSKKILTDILRVQLNFEGVIITDDFEMGAITNNYEIKDAAVESIKAGTDIILVCHTAEKQIEILEGLKEAVHNDEISIERIDQSVKRIIKLKEKYDLNNEPSIESKLNTIGNEKHKEVLKKLSE